jgi:MYXO-CTERM domain-containing protein
VGSPSQPSAAQLIGFGLFALIFLARRRRSQR